MDKEVFESVVKTLNSDLVQVTAPDAEAVAALILKAKGENRTLKEFADATGISAPTLSRFANGKITRPLSPDTIVTIISNSESNTLRTMYELARANGYMSKAEAEALRSRYQLRDARNGAYASSKSYMFTVIMAELFQRGFSMDKELLESKPDSLCTAVESAVRYDFAVEVDEGNSQYIWTFFAFPQHEADFSSGDITSEKLARNILRELSPVFLTDAWLPAQYDDYKLSFCFVDKEIYRYFCYLAGHGQFNNRFSAILIDEESGKLIEEKVLPTKKKQDSLLARPLKMAISFEDDGVADEVGECNFIFVSEGEEDTDKT